MGEGKRRIEGEREREREKEMRLKCDYKNRIKRLQQERVIWKRVGGGKRRIDGGRNGIER